MLCRLSQHTWTEAGPEAAEVAGTGSPRCLCCWKELELNCEGCGESLEEFQQERNMISLTFSRDRSGICKRKFISVLPSHHTLFFNGKLTMFSFSFLSSDIWWFAKIKSMLK